jgi:ABC-2 type transport system permease protein
MSASLVLPIRTVLALEVRLALRRFTSRSGDGGLRNIAVALVVAAMIAGAHGLAAVMTPKAPLSHASEADLAAVAPMLIFAGMILVAAAIDSAVHALHQRADYDLLFSAPLPPRMIFLIRALNVALVTFTRVLLYSAPLINVMVWRHGNHFLAGYGVLLAMAMIATCIAIAIILLLMALGSTNRIRILAQVFSAVAALSAVFMLQRRVLLPVEVNELIDAAFSGGLPIWLEMPTRASLGDLGALAVTLVAGIALSALALALLAEPFVKAVVKMAGSTVGAPHGRVAKGNARFGRSPLGALFWKERQLVLRDPSAISQVLMPCLFLLPVGLSAFQNARSGNVDFATLVAVVIITMGQIAGGLTFVAMAADDAGDMVTAAPVDEKTQIRAKLAAVASLASSIAMVPLLLIAWANRPAAAIAVVGIVLAVATGILVNLWHQPIDGSRHRMRRRGSGSAQVALMEIAVLLMIGLAGWLVISGYVEVAPVPLIVAALLMGVLGATRKRV